MKATLMNIEKLILKKYQYNIYDYDDELVDEQDEDLSGNYVSYWQQIWKFGDRYFKFLGENDFMYEDCVEVFPKQVETTIYTVEK